MDTSKTPGFSPKMLKKLIDHTFPKSEQKTGYHLIFSKSKKKTAYHLMITTMENNKNCCTLTDSELKSKSEILVHKLAQSGGKSWSLKVPVDFNSDPDMIFIELGKRLKERNIQISKLEAENEKVPYLIELLKEASLQIEHLHSLFQPTGTGNSTLSRIETAIYKIENK